METKDQLPSGGCDNCSKYEGLSQAELRKRLVRYDSMWLCRECEKDMRRKQEDE